MTKKHSKNNYSDNAMKTIAYIISTYHIGTYDLDIRDVLKSYIIARYYGWEPITRKQKSFINLRYQTYSNN